MDEVMITIEPEKDVVDETEELRVQEGGAIELYRKTMLNKGLLITKCKYK